MSDDSMTVDVAVTWARIRYESRPAPGVDAVALKTLADEVERLTAALEKANEQAERFEREWYLAKESADRYAFAKTLEGQVVTMETFKNLGAEFLDEKLAEVMAADEDWDKS